MATPAVCPAAGTARDAGAALRGLIGEVAGGGEAELGLRMAEAAAMLWTRVLKFDAADPHWPDRDRFIVSAGHGALLLHALLHLTGHDGVTRDALLRFCPRPVPADGDDEYPAPLAQGDDDAHPAVEAMTGPPGQGLANGLGMALAERLLAARFGRSLVDHRTWVLCDPADLADGLAQEAASLAGSLRLERLAVLCDAPAAAGAAETARRFAALDWTVRLANGWDGADVATALALALRSRKPTLIICRECLPAPATPALAAAADDQRPNGAADHSHRPDATTHWRTAGANEHWRAAGANEHWRAAGASEHWRPAGASEHWRAAGAREHWRAAGASELWRAAGARGSAARRAWLKRLTRHTLRAEFERAMSGRLPELLHERIAALRAQLAGGAALSTEAASRAVQQALAPHLPELTGNVSHGACPQSIGPAVAAGQFLARQIAWQGRAHAMAAAMNGMALHGGLLPCGDATLIATDRMRPALRLAALSRLRVILLAGQDSIGQAADDPAWLPVEQLATLRALPNCFVFRPADAMETVECWDLALRRSGGPTVLALGSTVTPAPERDTAENRCARGGYLLATESARQVTLIASGAEVALALAARALLAREAIAAAVVSLPCWELFAAQDASYRAAVLGEAPRVGIEAGCGFGWERWLGAEGVFVGRAWRLGLTAGAVVQVVRRVMG